MLVASIKNLDELERVRPLADLIELRLDCFSIDAKPDVPCIFTLRSTPGVSESERLARLEKLLELGAEYCDIEVETDPAFIQRISQKFPKVKLIGSYHNFEETPLDLEALLQRMYNPRFAIYKIAVAAKSTLDMLRLMIFARGAKVPLSVISMGPFGRPSRVLAPIVHSALDYAGLEDEPDLHRYSLQTLHDVFHYRKLNQNTRIYALIGHPVEQSPGHLFHNSRFKHNAVYVKMDLALHEVPEFFQLIKQLPFGGLSVTIPLKEAVASEMDELIPNIGITPVAKAIGAINTVVFRDGKAIGTNTDGAGALNAIEKHTTVKGKRLAILGAGGTARAIAFEAIRRGALVSIYNRTSKRAKQLASEFGCTGYGLDELRPYDILVNTIPPSRYLPTLLPNTIVMDVVYAPKETPLLAEAKRLGCICIYGEEMFVQQALLQQQEWNTS